MPFFGSHAGAAGQAAAPWSVTHSAAFDGSTGYLSDTFGVPTSGSIWTFWAWFRQDTFAANRALNSGDTGIANDNDVVFANSTDNRYSASFSDGVQSRKITTATANTNWHYICLVFDLAQGAGSKQRIWYDGSLETLTGTERTTAAASWNANGVFFTVGARRRASAFGFYLDGNMAYVGFLDGTADATLPGYSGGSPAEYTGGAFGNNGYLLEFQSSGNLGLDTSGNGNDLTTTGGVTQSTDVPT